MIPSPCLSVTENNDRKKTNMDRTQTKLSTPQIRYKVKTVHQKLTIQDKLILEKISREKRWE